jgi:hypothetical protein
MPDAPDWPSLVRMPADFADGPVADAWFARIADALLNRTEFRVGGQPHRLIEVEVYYFSPAHPDPFAHQDPVQLDGGRWYFHKTRGEYRGGSFKGLDLAFGDGTAFAGVLFRGLEKPDGTYVDGPSLLVDHLLSVTGCASVAELDHSIGARHAWDRSQPLQLVPAATPQDRPVLRTARVGLSWRRHRPNDPSARFLLRPYRFLTEPRRTAKGKPHMVLALHAAGTTAEEITRETGCPPATVRRYVADYEAGERETDLAPYHGREWTTADLCRLHGLLGGERPLRG